LRLRRAALFAPLRLMKHSRSACGSAAPILGSWIASLRVFPAPQDVAACSVPV